MARKMTYTHTPEELKQLQALSLEEKIVLSKLRITEWYEHWQGRVYVSYSGGKDSTVLLKLVRELYPEVPAVYIDTRLDYPEVREFIKNTENVFFLKPEITFREAIRDYGFCYPNKEVAKAVRLARLGKDYELKRFEGKNPDGTESELYTNRYKRWAHLVTDTRLKISDKCCDFMKEKPIAKYNRANDLHPYVALLATESFRRRNAWYLTGCNAFKSNKSKPLSFWSEQDILEYILKYDVKIPSIYGEIIRDSRAKGKLKTTGEKRTGCIFCPISAYMDKPNRFQKLKESHPSLYNYCMSELGLDEFLTAVGVEH